jgi:hypothetical protein
VGCRRDFLILAVSLLFVNGMKEAVCQAPDSPPGPNFRQLLQKLASADADPCDAPGDDKEDTGNTENLLLQQAEREIMLELNTAEARSFSAAERASTAFKRLERMSAEINAAWPDKNRLHFEIVELPPLLLVKITIRTHAAYVVFGVPEGNPTGTKPQWLEVGSGDEFLDQKYVSTSLEIYPLQRSTSEKIRFLASFSSVGCAGNTFGIQYDAREWDPKKSNYLEQIIKQDGAFNIDADPNGAGPTAKDPFAPVGVLSTTGAKLTLPYCWGSPLDTWDNLSLCAVDTYDLSGEEVRFVGRRYNRPDLVPVAKVIEYAQKHDSPEVLAYCASTAVASKIMHDLSGGYSFDTQLVTVQLGTRRERVRAAYSDDPGFVVEKRGDRWLVVSYSAK